MALETIETRGPWKLMRARSSTPQWVGWVHESAEGWRREVVRILEAAERANIDGGATGAYLNNQRLFVRDLHIALGQLARSLDLPMPSFEPWAKLQWLNDPGADPWPGWNLARPLWRYDIQRAAERGTEQIREASAAGRAVLSDLWYRVRLSDQGLLVPPAPGVPADVWMTLDAPATVRGVDARASVCFGLTAVEPDFSNAPAMANRSVWNCVNYAAWWPGVTAAEQESWVSALVPLRWHWQMAAGAADRVRELGTIEDVITACRQWIAMKNLKAIAAVERLTGEPFEFPEDLLTWTAENSGPGRWRDTTAHQVMTIAASAVGMAGPVGAVIGLVLTGLDLVLQYVGTARGYFIDPWGRREVQLELPRLTGYLDAPRFEPPTHAVMPAPNYAPFEGINPGGRAADLARARRAARAGSARVVGGIGNLPRDSSGPAPVAVRRKKASGGKVVATGAGLYVLVKLLGG